ncbi:helix-turn-helix transcriptional regulator [Pedobacter sp.]|nr:helix-turn-helix transcriptional regulator [Candidatus Saccharibacteria bacterium]
MKNTTTTIEPRVGCIQSAMDIIGTKWTALLLRDLTSGPKRFSDFERSISELNPRTLSRRLDDLQEHGIVETCDSLGGGSHLSYRLTKKGEDLLPVLRKMAEWGEKYPAHRETVA